MNAEKKLGLRLPRLRKKGTDGLLLGLKPALKKVVNDRRASLHEEEIKAEMRRILQREFVRPNRARHEDLGLAARQQLG